MRQDARIVVQMRIGGVHAIDCLGLPGTQRLMRIEAARAGEHALSPEHFVQAGDASGESVRRIEEGRVRVRHLFARPQQRRRHRIRHGRGTTRGEQLHRLVRYVEAAIGLAAHALARHAGREVVTGTGCRAPAWCRFFDEHGFREQRPFIRMCRGGPLPIGEPHHQLAVLGPEFG